MARPIATRTEIAINGGTILEKNFGVGISMRPGVDMYEVRDAEGVVVAECSTETLASLVAAALNAYRTDQGKDVVPMGSSQGKSQGEGGETR